MNISAEKDRTALGEKLFAIEEWRRLKIKAKLLKLGFTEGKWRGMHERVEAHLLPAFVRDVIVEEIPEVAELFHHPDLKSEVV